MRKSCRYHERWDQERGDGGCRDIGVRVRNVIEHAEVQQGVGKAQHASRDDRRPKGRLAIGGEGEPEQRDGEQPDGDEGGEEPRFRTVLPAALEAVALEEVGLHGHEAEHDGHADEEVEVGVVRLQRGETVVEGEDGEDAVEVEEQEAVSDVMVSLS